MNKICQVRNCGKPAEYNSFPGDYVRVTFDEIGMQTCAAHLSDGMSHVAGTPEPEYWRVFPLVGRSSVRPAPSCTTSTAWGEESRRLHREYNVLVEAQRNGAKNGADVMRLTDECNAKGIILVPGGENL
jgi:hypothetical protein